MAQRVFDMENDKDIKDLFDILPDWVEEISPVSFGDYKVIELYGSNALLRYVPELNINWHGKTYIDRPVDESKWIGCLCWFFDDDRKRAQLGVLDRIVPGDEYPYKTKSYYGQVMFINCRPVMRNEIKFAEDKEK